MDLHYYITNNLTMQTTNPDKFRENVRVLMLCPILANEEHALNLEKAIFNWSLKEAATRKIVKKWENPYFVELYKTRLRTIFTNLKTNPELVASIGLGEGQTPPHVVAFMSHQEMLPDKWACMITKKNMEDENRFENNIQAATDTITCRKCRSKKCTYTQVQTRGADEAMTLFISCLDCGARWKM